MKEREERGGKLRGLGKSKESCKRKDSGKRKLTTGTRGGQKERGEREKCKEEEIVEGREKEDGEMKVRDEGSSEEQRKVVCPSSALCVLLFSFLLSLQEALFPHCLPPSSSSLFLYPSL